MPPSLLAKTLLNLTVFSTYNQATLQRVRPQFTQCGTRESACAMLCSVDTLLTSYRRRPIPPNLRSPALVMPNTPKLKAVIVGDEGIGKTSLIKVFSPEATVTIRSGPGDVNYTSCEQTHAVGVDVDSQHVQLELWDTAGEEGFDRLRPLTYPCSDVFLVCFSVDFPASFSMVAKKWIPEIRHHCPRTPFILVGCKKDLRDDHAKIEEAKSTNETFVTTSQGQSLAPKIGAVAYLECSAERRQGVDEVFHAACRAAFQQGLKQKRSTCIVQ